MKNKHLMVVAAHPDDEVLGCGATVRLKTKQGWQASLVTMTRGIAGRYMSSKTDKARPAQDMLAEESSKAGKILGFTHSIQFDYPDNRLDTIR